MCECRKKKILIAEDEAMVRDTVKRILKSYENELEIMEVDNAGNALDFLFPHDSEKRPIALILDITMPYGSAENVLDTSRDAEEIETGVLLLEYIRRREKEYNLQRIWVSVITARENQNILDETEKLLDGMGKIYSKPYDDFEMENDLSVVLGIKSLVPSGLLPKDYQPPVIKDENT